MPNKYLAHLWKESLYLLSQAPLLIQDAAWLIHHLYANSPPMISRIPLTIADHTLKTFVFYNSSLKKDGNPTSSAMYREIPGTAITSYNAYNGVQYTSNGPELQDFTHVLGQSSRLSCKGAFQTFNYSDSVLLSRSSNVVCDSFGVIATDLSKQSQREGISIYYLTEALHTKNIHIFSYLGEKLTINYAINAPLRAIFKTLILDQLGEGIKLITNSLPTKNIIDDDIYTQINKTLETTNSSAIGYINIVPLIASKILSEATLDLTIKGPIMLSTAKDAVDFIGEAYPLDIAKSIIIASTASYYKTEIFSYLASITDDLTNIAVTMISDDDLYTYPKQNPLYTTCLLLLPYIFDNLEELYFSYLGNDSIYADNEL